MSVQEFVGDSLSPIKGQQEGLSGSEYYWLEHLSWHLETTVTRLSELVEASDQEMFRGVAGVMEGCFRSLLSRSVVSTVPEEALSEVRELQVLLSDIESGSDSIDVEEMFQSVLDQVELVSKAFK